MEASSGARASRGEMSYSVRTSPGRGLGQKMNKGPYEGRKQKVMSSTALAAREEPQAVVFCLSFHFISLQLIFCLPALQVSLCMQVCVYIDIYMSMCTKAIRCLMSQDRQTVSMPATLQLRLAAPKVD